MDHLCSQCGAPIAAGSVKCEYCGAAAPKASTMSAQTVHVQAPVVTQAPPTVSTVYNQPTNPAINMSWPIKSKTAAGVLAILLGMFGVHKFYLGQVGRGVVMLLFFWTYIPAIIGFIEGIIILCSKDENFQLKYQVRLQ